MASMAMFAIRSALRIAVQCIVGLQSCASSGLVANTNPSAARGLHRSRGCKNAERAHMRIFDGLRKAARCNRDCKMFLCFFGFRSKYCEGAPRDSTNVMMTAYTSTSENWVFLCQWRTRRAALADSKNSLNRVLARGRVRLARARATLAISRNTYRLTKRSYAEFMRLLDVDARYRQQMRQVAAAASKFAAQKEEVYRNLVSWGEMEEDALRAVDEAVRGVAHRSKEEVDVVRKADEAAFSALGVHAVVALMARNFGIGGRLSGRQWSLQLALVAADAALVIEGATEASWSLRQAALIALVLRAVHNILQRARPRRRRRRREQERESEKRNRKRDRAMRQALFLVRSLRGSGLDAPVVAADDAFCWDAKQWPDPREWEPE